jgi:DNA-binding transcriptional MerR regulator/effector-binding domain-containing protein
MLKISDFSKLAQVPVATLRFYDQINLLKPAQVDRFTDYRYYTVDQLPRLNRILALKDLGFGLEQIARLLQDNLSVSEMRGMLALRQADAERELQESQARLAKVAARLREIEQEGQPPKYDVVLKSVAPQWVISTREIVPTAEDMGERCWQLHGLLRDWMREQNLKPLGIPAPQLLNLYYNTEYTEVDLDLEAAVMVSKPRPMLSDADFRAATVLIHSRELPGEATVASGIHQGAMDELHLLIKAILCWVSENGYSINGPLRELHFASAAPQPGGERLVEIQVPVAM